MILYNDLHQYYSRFSAISLEDWLCLEANVKPIEFSKGDTIFKVQEKVKDAVIIRKGIAKTYYTTRQGKEFIKIFLTDGQIVSSYLENISGVPSRTHSKAVTDISALSIPFDTLMQILDSSPAFIQLHLRMVQMFYAMKERREYELLTLDAAQRYQHFLQEYGQYASQIPNMSIASYLGITPVSLSRLRGQQKT